MSAYIPLKPDWSHQIEAKTKSRGKAAFAYLMAMRTGKTKVTLDDFGEMELGNECQDLAVVAPGGAYLNWETAIDDHLSLDLRRRIRPYVWKSGSGVVAKRVLDDFMLDYKRPRMLIMNIEATSVVKKARETLVTFLKQRRSEAVYDESTGIKGHDSERALFAVNEVKPAANYRRILSGLPTPKSPLDAYMQFNFLDEKILGFGSWHGMRNYNAVTKMMPVGPILRKEGRVVIGEDGKPLRRSIPQIVAYREVGSVQKKIAAHSVRVRLEDCYDMPAKMYEFRDVDWHPEQKRIYDELLHFATAELASREFVTVQNVISQLTRLHQVLCGHVRTEAGELREVPEKRTESLLTMLEEYDGKAVIWCSYDYNVKKLSEAISKRFAEFGEEAPVARFWGGNRSTREAEEKQFSTDPRCRWMVATPAAARFSRYWAFADLAVYFSNTADYEHRSQSEERIQAVGKKVSSGYVDMRVRGSIDMRWIETIRKKMDLAAAVVGDEWREWVV